MPTFQIPLQYGDFDILYTYEGEGMQEVLDILDDLKANHPEIKPRPRFTKGETIKIEFPFVGHIKSVEAVPAKDGKKAFNLATITNAGGQECTARYYGPVKMYKAGMKVQVSKGQYGPDITDILDDDDTDVPVQNEIPF